MSHRDSLIHGFLATTDWSTAARGPLAGDASNRRYLRLERDDGTTAVLMDAPPEKGENVRPFVQIANHLCDLGLSAPRILHADMKAGFLLLEDLGDALFARVVADTPKLEHPLYEAATDVLVSLHSHPPLASLAPYSPKVMANMSALAHRWYARGADQAYEEEAHRFEPAFEAILARHAPETNVLIQRDYHAENLLWLPDRKGIARVGLLDFQDAMAGHRAYDLVSLLQDARRGVSPDVETTMIGHYCARTGCDRDRFDAAYHVLGAQRNLRIVGVFARLSMHFGKPHYVDFIPRVWAYLMRDLAHPALAEIKDTIPSDLPEPTDALLQKLKNKCATIPTL